MEPGRSDGSWLAWLEQSGPAAALRESAWAYPIVETLHILGFVLLAGAAALFDLRLLGLSRTLSVSALARHLLRWSRIGAAVVVPTGVLLFASDAPSVAANPAFRLKLLLIALAAANAAAFHRFTFPSVHAWDRERAAPPAARLAGAVSLLLWSGVIACGRLIAYV